jgi:3-oxoacyl-[acyl-carrier-protein] synthase-1
MENKKRPAMNIIGTNVISALGLTTNENFQAVKSAISGVKNYDVGTFDLPEAFMASLIDKERLNDEFYRLCSFRRNDGYTDLEKAAILSVYLANQEAQIDLSSEKVLFVLSTTKGNVDFLDSCHCVLDPQSPVFLWNTAKLVSQFFDNPNTPLVVSNACISGAAAQIAALRTLQSGRYDNAVVVGTDFLSKFIISGFQSFKALSTELCKPFDKDRCGLNLGEAAATIIFNNGQSVINNGVQLLAGAIRNDANHISAPSRTGEGCYKALHRILQDIDTQQIAFINAHGTATLYNDAMEVQAIIRAGLADVPVFSLKFSFGHTLGAAGVLESIISMCTLQENLVLKSMNYNAQDFEHNINIATENHFSEKQYFIKLLSGFGGVNAALLFKRC